MLQNSAVGGQRWAAGRSVDMVQGLAPPVHCVIRVLPQPPWAASKNGSDGRLKLWAAVGTPGLKAGCWHPESSLGDDPCCSCTQMLWPEGKSLHVGAPPQRQDVGTRDRVLGLSLSLWSPLCFPLAGARVGLPKTEVPGGSSWSKSQEDFGASDCHPPDWSPCPPHPGTPRAHPVLVPALSTTHQAAGCHNLYCHHRLPGPYLAKPRPNHEPILRDPSSPAGMKRLPPIEAIN